MLPVSLWTARFWIFIATIWVMLEARSHLLRLEMGEKKLIARMWMALFLSLLLTWFLPMPFFDRPIEEGVYLLERYGGKLGGSNDVEMRLDNNTLIKNKFAEGKRYKFTPMIDSNNSNIALTGLDLFVTFPENVLVEHSRKHWRLVESSQNTKRYWIPLGTATYGKPSSVIESLSLVFPKPGKYPIGCAFARNGSGKIERNVGA